MKPKRTAITLTTLLLLPLGAAPLSAATRTWDAGGATNDWNIAANWSSNTAPVAGDSLVFPVSAPGSPTPVVLSAADKEMNNNIAVNTFFAGLTFSSNGYSLTGNSFDLSAGGIVLSHTTGTTTISPGVRLQGAGQSFDSGSGSAALSLGVLNLNGNSLTLTGEGRIIVGNNIANTVGTSSTVILTKAGGGDADFDGFNNFIGTVEVTAGRLFANGFLAGSGAVNVRTGGTLAGEDGGIDKDVLIQGTLAPGTLSDSTRPMEFDGNLTFSTVLTNTRILHMDVRSATPGTGYDQISAGANVTLNSANLVLDFGTFKPAVGTPLVLINKTSTGAISGTFADIAQGATLTLDGQRLQFSYTGGDGNDFTATPLNVLPVAGSLGLSTNEDTAVAVPLSVTDPNPQTLTYTIVSSPANGTVTGTAPNLTYTPDANFSGTDSFTYRVNDGVGNSNTATVSITVTAVNDAPTATNMGDTQVWREDTDEDLNDIVVSDVDDINVTVTLTLSKPQAGRLTTGTAGIVTSTYNATTGEWRASGFRSNVNALLAGIIFEPSSNFDESFTIAVSVTDGDETISDTRIMGCLAVNDAPTATGLSALETYTEDINEDIIDIVISDVDDTNTTITLTMPAAAGALTFTPTAGVTASYIAATGIFTASGPITGVNSLLTTLIYDPALNFHGNFTLITNVSDGTNNVPGSKSMVATAVNDPPVASNLSSAEDYLEDTIEELTDIVVSDVDSSTITARLTLNKPSAGRLKEVSFGSVNSSFNATTGVWTASGPIAEVNKVLADVTFIPADNFNTDFDIITSISDGTSSVNGSKPVDGIAVNDVPTISVLPGRTIDEDGTTGPIAFTVNDPDGEVLTIDKSSSSLQLVPVDNIDVSPSGNSRTVTVTPAANRFGTATITLTVRDATSSSPPSSFVLTVNSVNDAPVISPIADISVRPGVSTGQIPFTATDVESSTLTIGKQTDNPGLVPLSNIILRNGPGGRTVEVIPVGIVPGEANITITADDGIVAVPTTRTFKVTVNALRPLEQWRQNQFGTTANSGDGADDFDFDRDGLTNLVEFAFGLDPKNPASSALPQPGQVDTNGDSIPDVIGIHFTPPAGVSDVVFSAETSTTLQPGSWTPVADSGTGQEKVFRIPLNGARGFMRLNVTPL